MTRLLPKGKDVKTRKKERVGPEVMRRKPGSSRNLIMQECQKQLQHSDE
jgi:hypothetical protein